MNSLGTSELRNYCQWIQQKLFGSQLQIIWTDGEVLVLEFHRSGSYWLCVDLNMQRPFLVLSETKPVVKKASKPVSLFLNANAKNFRFQEISMLPEMGRMIHLELAAGGSGTADKCELIFQLIPRAANLLVKCSAQNKLKQMSWHKPKEMPASAEGSDFVELTGESLANWISDYHFQAARNLKWLGWAAQTGAGAQAENLNAVAGEDAVGAGGESLAEKKTKQLLDQKIQKKERAIREIEEGLAKNEVELWQKLGESLKYSGVVPSELARFYDDKLSRAANRERAFKKSKDMQRKRKGTADRLALLRQELVALQQNRNSPGLAADALEKKSIANPILKKSKSRARKLVLAGGLEAVIGKSAADNLAILRQARAWDYWFHLRDYSGAHAILFRNKNQEVPHSEIEKVAQWVIQESVSKKEISLGQKYDVIVAECRFVRPIKGAVGSVNFSNERMFTFASKVDR